MRRWRAALLGCLLVSSVVPPLAGCGGPNRAATAATERVETGTLDGQATTAVLPPTGVPVRGLVVFLHGLDQKASSLTTDPDVHPVASALAADGFAVVASDAAGDNFGSPTAVRDDRDLALEASKRYGTSATLLLAESMGGLAAVPLAASGTVPHLVGTVGISPALSFTGDSLAVYGDAARAAWGRPLTAADDPLATNPAALAGQHFRFYVSPGDATVPTVEHADAFRRRFGAVADVTLVACHGGHVDASCFRPREVAHWATTLLTSASPPTSAQTAGSPA